jgi:hypothetical protein
MHDAVGDEYVASQELIRRYVERFNAGDREVREDDADPECEICSAMTGSVYRGYDGARSWMQEIDEQLTLGVSALTSLLRRRGNGC